MKVTIESQDLPMSVIKTDELIKLQEHSREYLRMKLNPRDFVMLGFRYFVENTRNLIINNIKGEPAKGLGDFLKKMIPPVDESWQGSESEKIWNKFLEWHENHE